MKRFLIGIPFGVAVGSILLNFLFFILFSWTYSALTEETEIAKIQFSKPSNESTFHIAHISGSDGSEVGKYQIYGEQWRIDAKFMKMKYWANILGLDSRYALERFEGRYKKNEDQNTKQKLSYDLGEDTFIDIFSFFGWNPFVDTEYGSSAYQDIKINKEFTVYKTQTGLIIRTAPIIDINTSKKGFFSSIL